MDRRVVVTGAHGFLGRHVARCLARNGHTVVGIGHGEWPRAEWESWGLSQWHPADVTLQSLVHHAGAPTAIVHCAGSGSVAYSIENPVGDFERTVATTEHVLEFVRLHAPACRVVYPSSAGVYGAVESVPIREDSPTAPISQYGVHKLMAEQAITSHSKNLGTAAAIVRLFSVYGPGLRKQLLWDACRKFAHHDNVFMGTGDEVRDWLHVEDAAELLRAAMEHASAECLTVNGGSGEGATVREVLVHLGSFFKGEAPSFSGTQRAGDPSRYVAEIASARSWGWQPTRPWKAGVAEYAAWWSTCERT
jgi:UDP-glucose 4-epimerase